MSQDFVFPEEKSYFVENLRAMDVAEIGSKQWLDMHEKVIKLSQQATLEAAEKREEEIKELLITHDKLKVLVHEAYCVSLWKTRVLPHLLDICPNPQPTFLIYTVFFHEGAAISLLDTVLFHASTCEALQDCAIDLIDYCAQGVAQLIGLANTGFREQEMEIDINESVLSELERQKRCIIYKIGLRSISILSYLADNVSVLPVNATRRMITIHDIPWLIADVLHFAPWQRKTKKGLEKYIDEKWVVVNEENTFKVVKHEAQAWFCLRQILFNKSLMDFYEMNQERCFRLGGCEALLHETTMDQLPPLIELKQFLCQCRIAPPQLADKKKSDLLFEEIPEIKSNIIKKANSVGGFIQIAQHQEDVFLNVSKEKIMELANRLNQAYNTDMLADFEQKTVEEVVAEATATAAAAAADSANSTSENAGDSVKENDDGNPSDTKLEKKCRNCQKDAEKKCSKCLATFYCSRECQLSDWPKHKKICKAP